MTATVDQLKAQPQAISLAVFIEMLNRLPPEKILLLPVDRLPENIPSNISDNVPFASRAAVDDLLMASSSFHLQRRLHDQEYYGDEIVAAMDKANATGDSASVRVLKNKIITLVTMLRDAKENKKAHTTEQFITAINRINNLLLDVRSEQNDLYKTLQILKKTIPRVISDSARIGKALRQIKLKINTTDKLLGEYFILRLRVLSNVIALKQKEIQVEEEDSLLKRQGIQELSKQLDKTQSLWKRTLRRGKLTDEEMRIQQRIEELVYKLKASETIISENDLIIWLDAIVDASLNEHALNRVAKSLRDARFSLYYLLNKYCQKQEQAAVQIAQNPFLQVDPEKAINFVLMSEQFILDYFIKKKNETTAWLSGAAETKVQELDKIQKEILYELRKALKTRRA